MTNRVWGVLLIAICLWPISNVSAASKTEKTGNVLKFLIPSIAYGSTGYFNDAEGRVQFYKSFATNFVATEGLKSIIDKERPNGLNESFPSGHTSAAFQGASFIHKRYGMKYAIPTYIGAAFVGYSRVESDNHYIEDVLAGAAIGIASSFYFTTPYKGFTVKPTANNGAYGVSLSKAW